MNPISGGFVVPLGTTKSPEMGFIGRREGFQKSISDPKNRGVGGCFGPNKYAESPKYGQNQGFLGNI